MSRFDFEYKAPISLIYDDPMEHLTQEIVKKTDEVIYKTVLNTGVDVDKDELVKALRYDREQYEKGFQDGYDKGQSDAFKHAHWKYRDTAGLFGYDRELIWECSNCEHKQTNKSKYCPSCGANMEDIIND